MSTSNIVWIVIAAIVAILVIAAVVVVANRSNRRRRLHQAEEIREQARLESTKLDRRQALADETAARARAAQAEAEAKAAEAARLQDRATTHHSELANSREQLQEQWRRADSIDPKTGKETREGPHEGGEPVRGRGEAWSDESGEPPAENTDDYHDAQNRRGQNFRGLST